MTQFIASDHKLARLWVEACGKSLGIERAEAAAMYANLCGFRTWDAVTSAIGSRKPSAPDEQLEVAELMARRDSYIDVMVDVFALNPLMAVHLAANLSPSSSKLPRPIAIDRSTVHSPSEEDDLNLYMPGFDDPRVTDAMLKDFLSGAPGLEGVNLDNITERMRISRPVEPWVFWDFYSDQGFDLIEDSYDENYEYGTPSFFMPCGSEISEAEMVPVFLTSLAYTPLDHHDRMADEVRRVMLESAEAITGGDTLLLCWGHLQQKEIGGKRFTYAGQIHHKGTWHDLLLNRSLDSFDKLFNAAIALQDINEPGPEFQDKGSECTIRFFMVQTQCESSAEFFQKYTVNGIGNPSGWSIGLIGSKSE
ncbi:TPA: hypothetical protein ACG5DM_006520 [Pseudomonas putida]|uniref:Uncharacterized protein n=2 Tax=Pseudomonas TaxID=286 RepID=A0AAJ5V4C8_9PSED|nr:MULTISPECIES: hypothetical protein [Pseudomonas]MCT8164076.1 hypothetical protein [Pseudomonas sp. HD6422]MCT8182936.1 hypothetical protein [Pseudomonas sp. HD6421]MDH1930407.1 hypothetical protein [Pseudomonas sp. GD03696]MDM1711796.1 hypothetical protein [Pseudomonas sp. 165]ORL53094.1 hypothetical protein B7H18_03685 [Pseudomonas putida]